MRFDMTDQSVSVDELPNAYRHTGGRGLTSQYISNEVPPDCNPLEHRNQLVFAPGFLGGTQIPNSGRLSIGAKSPLTGGIKESNVGGSFALNLSMQNIAALAIRGKPQDDNLYVIQIDPELRCTIHSATPYRNLGTYATVDELTNRFGKQNSVLVIGPAGEQMLKSASIQATDLDGRPCRAAGRGGLGAVMGSKGVKAIVLAKPQNNQMEVAEKRRLLQLGAVFSKAIMEAPFSGKVLRKFGTAALVGPVNSLGAFPTFNARTGVFPEWKDISGEELAILTSSRNGKVGHKGCSRCIIKCSNIFHDQDNRYLTSSLEYETIWASGGMCGIHDLDAIAQFDFLCDDLGLDTINTGVAIAVAMDAGHLKFGDANALREMVKEVMTQSDLGRAIGNGPDAVGSILHHDRVPVVKHQSIAAYDPRSIKGMAVTYCSSPMGADHTAGNLIGESLSGVVDPLRREGQVEASRKKQILAMGLDCAGLCLFTGSAIKNDLLTGLFNARFGTSFSSDHLNEMMLSLLKLERNFNQAAGLKSSDDRLPQFFYDEPLPPNFSRVDLSDEDINSIFQ
jgi:aldehyde:ferredoxin oxidoreductase